MTTTQYLKISRLCTRKRLCSVNRKSGTKMHQLILDQQCGLQFPITLKIMTVQETKEYHLKKLLEWSCPEPAELEFRVDGSLWKNGKPIVESPTCGQKFWVLFRLHSPNTWPNIRENRIEGVRNSN